MKSSRNAAIHGVSTDIVLAGESHEAYRSLQDAYIQRFRPLDQPELDQVVVMAVCQWRLRRIWSIETQTPSFRERGESRLMSQYQAALATLQALQNNRPDSTTPPLSPKVRNEPNPKIEHLEIDWFKWRKQ